MADLPRIQSTTAAAAAAPCPETKEKAASPLRPFTLVTGEAVRAAPPAPAPEALPAGPLSPRPAAAASFEASATRTLTRLLEDERTVDRGLRAAMSGKMLSAQELLVLQAQVIQYSQALEVVSRVVDKAAAGVRQVMSAQV